MNGVAVKRHMDIVMNIIRRNPHLKERYSPVEEAHWYKGSCQQVESSAFAAGSAILAQPPFSVVELVQRSVPRLCRLLRLGGEDTMQEYFNSGISTTDTTKPEGVFLTSTGNTRSSNKSTTCDGQAFLSSSSGVSDYSTLTTNATQSFGQSYLNMMLPYFHVCRTVSCEHETAGGDVTQRMDPPASTTTTSAADCGPPIEHSATGQSPVWRVNDTILRGDEPHHLVLTWNLPAHYVEVRGTFTQPPWADALPMWWCPRTQCHWIDLHESFPKLSSGLVQFKFVADGTWKCDPNYPICDDGGPKHSHNNVCVIFPQRIRMRLSNQRLRRRQSTLTTLGPPSPSHNHRAPGNLDSPPSCCVSSTWVCGNNSPRRCGRQLSRVSRKIQRSNHNTLSSKPAWASSTARKSPHEDSMSVTGSSRSPIAHMTNISSPVNSVIASSFPPTVGASNTAPINEPTIVPRLTGSIEETTALKESLTEMTNSHRPSASSVSATATHMIERTPTISGSGANTAQQCRKWLIEQSTYRHADSVSAAWEHSEAAPVARERRREKQKHLDTLVRCLSHHGGRRHRIVSERTSRERSRIAHWPAYITCSLHDPDVMLELDLPKVLKVRNESLSLRSGWSMACHPEKRHTGGADAFYISTDGNLLALADGVGAWDELGVNSRDYADELINGIREVWENKSHAIHTLKLKASLKARELMLLGSRAVVSYGSATCCIVLFDPHRQEVGVCNLGDSGVCLLRRNNLFGHITPYFKTSDMIHFFNCPYQLSKIPSRKIIQKKLGASGSGSSGCGFILPVQDSPKHSECFDLKVEEGDLIVLASDGLWDNLWSWELSSLCTLTLTPLEALILHDDMLTTEANDIAKALTEAASYKSQNPKSTTPFAKNYTAECGMPTFTGGKWDDITVLCSWVARNNNTSPSDKAEVYGANGELLAAKEELTVNSTLPGSLTTRNAFSREEWRWPYICHSDGDLSPSEDEA